MEFNFRNDLENLDDRSKMANMMLKLIYQKHNGDLDKCLPDVREASAYLQEHVRNIYEVIEGQVPLICYLNLVDFGAKNYNFTKTEYHEAMEATDRACSLYYGDKSDVAVTDLFYKAVNSKAKEHEIQLQDQNIATISDKDPKKEVQKLADELGLEVSFTSSFKYHENDKSKEGPKNRREEFAKVVRPVMKCLCENHHPHTSIIIDGTNAQLLEGLASTGQIMDYVKD